MAITGPPIEAELRNRALDAVYGAVLQPEHYTAIIKAMGDVLDESIADHSLDRPTSGLIADLGVHFDRAARVFSLAKKDVGRSLEHFLANKAYASIAATKEGRVVRNNAAAQRLLGDLETLEDLPLRSDAYGQLREYLKALPRDKEAPPPPTVLVGTDPSGDRGLVFVLEVMEEQWDAFREFDVSNKPDGPVILVKSTATNVLDETLQLAMTAFGLTKSELQVISALAQGKSLRHIAQERDRSQNTLKTQLQSVFRKTATTTQGQLLCMLTALAHLSESKETGPHTYQLCRPKTGHVAMHSLELIGGRTQKYLELGAPQGRAVLCILPGIRPDFTAEIVDALAARNLRAICPIRPGSWGMPRWSKWGPIDASLLYASLIDALDLQQVGVLSVRTGAPYAIQLLARLAERGGNLVLVDSGAPLDRLGKFRAMPAWPRTLFVAARFFPDLLFLPFRYCASDFWSGPEGARRAIEAYYWGSPSDLRLLNDPTYFEIARRNFEYFFEHTDQVAKDMAVWTKDWSKDLIRLCDGGTKVNFLHGTENPAFPAEDIL
ncbi:MAG: LuxR C-terminal-related transcriptional regulator, partial [Pseudomonadota bacterium]